MSIWKRVATGGCVALLAVSTLSACSDKKDKPKAKASPTTVPIDTTFVDALGRSLVEQSASISFAAIRPALDACPGDESKMEGNIAFPEGSGRTTEWEEILAGFVEFDASFDLDLGADYQTAGGTDLGPIDIIVIDGNIYVDMHNYLPLFEFEPPYPPRWDEKDNIGMVEVDFDAMEDLFLGEWNPDSALITYLAALLPSGPVENLGTEQIEGVATWTHYASSMSSPFGAQEDVQVDVWIDEAGRLAKVEFEAEFTSPLDHCEAAGSAHAKTTFTMLISDYGNDSLDELELGEEPMSYAEFQEITGLPS